VTREDCRLFLRARLTIHSTRRRFAARLNSGVRRLHALMKQLTPEVLAEAVALIKQLRSGALDDAAISDTVV
jgi:hypothetical protein